MARSTYIYTVTLETDEFLHIIACFTVKHECLTWCKRRVAIYPEQAYELEVQRHYDNPLTTDQLENVHEYGNVAEFLEKEDI